MNEFTASQGLDNVVFLRRLQDAAVLKGARLALQTTHNIDISSDTDSTASKDGPINTASSAGTTFEVENILSDDALNDIIRDSAKNHTRLEAWSVNLAKKDSQGRYFAEYMQGFVNELSSDADADDLHTGDATFTIDGVPAEGYLELSDANKESIRYAFRGLDEVTAENPNGGGVSTATAITVDADTLDVVVGATQKITATLQPTDAKDPVVYNSYDPTIATVSEDGTVTGVKAGTTKVIVQTGVLFSIVTVTVTAG